MTGGNDSVVKNNLKRTRTSTSNCNNVEKQPNVPLSKLGLPAACQQCSTLWECVGTRPPTAAALVRVLSI